MPVFCDSHQHITGAQDLIVSCIPGTNDQKGASFSQIMGIIGDIPCDDDVYVGSICISNLIDGKILAHSESTTWASHALNDVMCFAYNRESGEIYTGHTNGAISTWSWWSQNSTVKSSKQTHL
jgi:hypothetical protein